MRIVKLVITLVVAFSLHSARICMADGYQGGEVLFSEDFENDDFQARGWYDGPRIETTDEVAKNGERSCVWHWTKGATLPGGKGGRVLIEPSPQTAGAPATGGRDRLVLAQ